MIKIKENRLFVLEEDGNWVNYLKEVGTMHDDCLINYCKRKELEITSTIPEMIGSTNSIIFYNVSDDVIIVYLPSVLSDEQLYQLELFDEEELMNVTYLEARKIGEQEEEFYLEDDVARKFSEEVIQSYYRKGSKQR